MKRNLADTPIAVVPNTPAKPTPIQETITSGDKAM